jgi:hypothetical protein
MELLQEPPLSLDPERAQSILWKALKGLQDRWDFTNLDMAKLLHVRANTYGNWMARTKVPFQRPPFSPETELVVTVLSIYRSLGAMFSSHKDQTLWLTTTHPDFQRLSPLAFAQKSCENLFYLKNYLDYVRGRGA